MKRSKGKKESKGSNAFEVFLREHQLTHETASKALGVSRISVLHWVNGVKRPDAHMRRAIAAWTAGKIPAEDWEFEEETAKVAHILPFAEQETPQAATGTEG